MRKVVIVTDSSCDVLYSEPNLYQDFGYHVVPLNVLVGEKTYKDYFDKSSKEIIAEAESLKILPKTSSPSVGDFINKFKELIDQDFDIVFVGLGSKFSSTYNNACIAAEEFEKGRIYCVDSNTLSSAIGMKVILANEMAKNGKSAEEIATFLNSLNTKIHCEFTTKTLEYLHKGGRCSGVAFLVGVVLRVLPIISVDDEGKMIVANKVVGYKLAIKNLIDRFMEKVEKGLVDLKNIFITHFMSPEEAILVKQKLIDKGIKEESIFITETCSTVASHCGPGCLGIIHKDI